MGQMMMFHSILMILVVSISTVLLRSVPFLLFGGKKDIPKTVGYLGNVLPAAMIGVLVIYCFKSVQLTSLGGWIPQLAGGLAVVLLHLKWRSTLIGIAGGTAFYMVLIRISIFAT